jgi:hypothetical protein
MITVIAEAVLREWITHTRRKGQAVRLWLIYRLQVGLILAALKIPVRVLCPCAALGHGVPRPRTSTASTAHLDCLDCLDLRHQPRWQSYIIIIIIIIINLKLPTSLPNQLGHCSRL